MIKTDAGGYPVIGEKYVDGDGVVLTVEGYHKRPSVVFYRPDHTKVVYGEGSQLIDALKPYEEPKPVPRCEPRDKKDGQHWLGYTGPEDEVPSIGRVQVWDFIDGCWQDSDAQRFTPEEQAEEGWMYLHPALFSTPPAPTPLRTTIHRIGDISTETHHYAADYTDDELSALYRDTCSRSGTLSPAEIMLRLARRVLNGEKV